MTGSCLRKLTFRWALLAFVPSEVGILIYRLLAGRWPLVNTILIAQHHQAGLPLLIPRWVDPLVMMIPMAAIAWASFSHGAIKSRYSPNNSQCADGPIIFGLIFGLVGSFIILNDGFEGMLYGTLLACFLLIVSRLCGESENWQLVVVALTAATTLWLLNTLYQGSIAGFVYAVASLAVAAPILVAAWAILSVIPPLARWFGRTMLACGSME